MVVGESVGKLIGILEEQVQLYQLLLDIVRREKEFLISADMKELAENTRGKEGILLKIRALDKMREPISKQCCGEFGLSLAQPKLLEIANKSRPEAAERLRAIHGTLELLISRIKEFNDDNEALAKSALLNIQGAMNNLKENLEPNKTYKKEGAKAKAPVVPGQLVSREA